MWFTSAFLIGLGIAMFMKIDHPVALGIGFDRLNLPGTIIGLLIGIHSARATIKRANQKALKKTQNHAQNEKASN